MRRQRQLEEENRRLKAICCGPGARHSGAQGRARKKRLRPAVKRQMVAEVMSAPAVAASRLWADREHATRVKERAGGRSQPRIAATIA